MNNTAPLILVVDDEPVVLKLISDLLRPKKWKVETCQNSQACLETLGSFVPDVVLLDIRMPDTDGYELCSLLRKKPKLTHTPIIFLSALSTEQDRAKAFAVGGTDYLEKPIDTLRLYAVIEKHLSTKERWNTFDLKMTKVKTEDRQFSFSLFKEFLLSKSNGSVEALQKIRSAKTLNEFPFDNIAPYVSEFCGLPFVPIINPNWIQLDVLSPAFCRRNVVIPIKDEKGSPLFVVSNPFNQEFVDQLTKTSFNKAQYGLAIADKKTISLLLGDDSVESKAVLKYGHGQNESIDSSPISQTANDILSSAVAQRASDIHIEPKESHVVVRFRVDGEMKEAYALQKEMGGRLISRFKVLAGMDIAERRRAQDGSAEVQICKGTYKLRFATTSTPQGESLIIRILDPSFKPKTLNELGMTENQVKTMVGFAGRDRGLLLIVGATGSGKTTTIYSLLSQVDCQRRSLLSVEDPVEYSIPSANQQQVNEKAGINFETLLKSAMRQDPDILFLGEMRDVFSAKAAMDFTSTGHMTITSLHTSNATTAIFRLERLGTSRAIMADTIMGIVAQRLLKKLCPHCKRVRPLSQEEANLLAPYTHDLPKEVADPVGCPQCYQTGYFGREGVYEIIEFDRETTKMVRENRPISEIREDLKKRGNFLISDHAVEKARSLIFSIKDIYEKILVEEPCYEPEKEMEKQNTDSPVVKKGEMPSILVVEDDLDSRVLVEHLLKNRGYEVVLAKDGVEALLDLGRKNFSLIISDVDMPNLDGFKLLEMMNQKGVRAPVLFLTGRTSNEDESRGLELGAIDYIRKPIRKDVLLLRVRNVLEKG